MSSGRSDKGSDFWRNKTLYEDRRAKRSRRATKTFAPMILAAVGSGGPEVHASSHYRGLITLRPVLRGPGRGTRRDVIRCGASRTKIYFFGGGHAKNFWEGSFSSQLVVFGDRDWLFVLSRGFPGIRPNNCR